MKNINKTNIRQRLIITIIFTIVAATISTIAYTMMRSRIADMHIVFPIVLGMSAVIFIFLALWTLGKSDRFARFARIMRRCYITCLALGFVIFLIFQGLIISGASTQEADIDAMIVLGAGLRNNAPSLVLQTRLDAAIEYLETRENIPVIVSGGLGLGQSITEAEAMFHYLRTRGIDESLIFKEDASTNTFENLAFSREIMNDLGIDVENATIAIVSNEFHLFRAKHIASNAGLDAVGVAAATPGLSLRALYFFREAFALAAEVLL